MSTINLDHAIQAHGLLHRIGQWVSDFLDGISEARRMADRYRTLSHMTDEQLAALGLKRREIPHAILAGPRALTR